LVDTAPPLGVRLNVTKTLARFVFVPD